MDLPSPSRLAADVDTAFPALVAALAQPVYTVGLRLCGPQEAEDVAQEAFVRAYKALQEYPPERRRALKVRPWVLTIALNVARNRLRAHANGQGEPLDATVVDAAVATDGRSWSPEVAAEHAELRTRLVTALRRLPLPAQEAVVLRHIIGCPVAEVAQILDRPPGTVKAQVWRALAALREDLEAWEER